jgi:hypothetical protein
MTSHYRHRRTSAPATPFPASVEPGEIAVNTANRQMVVGDAASASLGAPLPLLPVRFFDARAQYAAGDFAMQAGALYRAKAALVPGAFNATQWDAYSSDATIKAYADAGDVTVTGAFQSADTGLQTQITGKVAKTGDTLTGPLVLPGAPTLDLQASTKKYVDDSVAAAGGAGVSAAQVANTPSGTIQSTDVQAALNELDTEKAGLASPVFLGDPRAPTPPANDNDTSIATTAFFAGQAGSSVPAMNGAQAVGVSLKFSREDHIHPTDTSRSPLASPAFTGVPTAPTAAPGTNTTQLATCAFALANAVADGSITFVKLANSALATVADFLSNVANKLLTTDKVWAAAVPVTLPNVLVTVPDFSTGIDFIMNMTGSGYTLSNPTNPKLGQKGILYLVQSSSGNCTITTWGTAYKFAGGVKPALSTAANAIDVISFAVKSATEVDCFFARGMA